MSRFSFTLVLGCSILSFSFASFAQSVASSHVDQGRAPVERGRGVGEVVHTAERQRAAGRADARNCQVGARRSGANVDG